MSHTTRCPCGSSIAYESCCARYHQGAAAPTTEALMRSRYSAYVMRLGGYLRDTWHPTTSPATITFGDDEPSWCGLEIHNTLGGNATDSQGEVEFTACWFTRDGKRGSLHERSRFVCEEGRWYYVDGNLFPTVTVKVGRNEPCPCASGRKFKQCCAG